jgi:GNAT superfamily N-acetyltransferase
VDIRFRKLEASDRTDVFDCGNAALNEFLRRYALKNQRRLFGVTHVAVRCDESPGHLAGYFTLANTAIPRQGLPEDMLKGAPKYEGLPAFLLARLAVDKRYQGKGVGELLLSHCLQHCLVLAQASGGRYLIADAKASAVAWYERYNFRKILGSSSADSTKMFLDLNVVKAAMEQKAGTGPE